MWLDSTPSMGICICHRCAPQKSKKQTKNPQNKIIHLLEESVGEFLYNLDIGKGFLLTQNTGTKKKKEKRLATFK